MDDATLSEPAARLRSLLDRGERAAAVSHLEQFERAAQRLYPGEYGDEQLFDRKRVAAIITGEFEQ